MGAAVAACLLEHSPDGARPLQSRRMGVEQEVFQPRVTGVIRPIPGLCTVQMGMPCRGGLFWACGGGG